MSTPTTDRAAIRAILTYLVAKGYRISGHNYHHDCTTDSCLTPNGCACYIVRNLDECNVWLRDSERNQYRLYFVLGNEPSEVLADYSGHTDDLLTKIETDINALCDTWEN